MIGINLRFTWAGGKRHTPIDLEASIEQGQAVCMWDQIFSGQARDYLRLDLGFTFHFYREKTEHIFSLEVQNLSNRSNVYTQYYDPYAELIREYPMTGFLPVFGYRIEF